MADLGLTSARWQILGAIAYAERPQPVAWLARDMGANRQNVQRIINDLHKMGLVAFEPNPHHRRAQLIALTEKGTQTFDTAMRLQVPMVNKLSEGVSVKDIETTHRVMLALRKRLGRSIGLDGANARAGTLRPALRRKWSRISKCHQCAPPMVERGARCFAL